MTPAGKLAAQPWMTAPETRAVVAALSAEGAAVRFVGGCVRDAVAGRPVKDIDLATPEAPEKVIALLRRAKLKAVPTGIDHGTVTAVAGGKPFEVTSLREDVETFGRHARVAFTDDWQADAARRDLTINALSCAPDGTLFDPFGGLADLAAGRVRFVGAARQRIEEDYLRLLRFFRFHAHYGRGDPDPDGLAAAADLAPKLAGLSAERVRDEVLRLLAARDPVPVLDVMLAKNILGAVLPEAKTTARLAALLPVEPAAGLPDTLRRLAALVEVPPADAEALARRLRLSRREAERFGELCDAPAELHVELHGAALRRWLYRLGHLRVFDALLLDWARRRAAGEQPSQDDLGRALDEASAWHGPEFPLRGRDVTALGIAKGPDVGRLLDQVEAWWEAQDFAPTREACLERLKNLVAAEG